MKNSTRKPRPTMSQVSALSACLSLSLLTFAAIAPAAAEGTDPQALRPLLLAPSKSAPSPSERHRATVYRSGLKRDVRQLERARPANPSTLGTGRDTHGRLGVQSRLNARRGELSRIDRGLGRHRR